MLAPPELESAFVAEIEELLKAADDDIASATRRQLEIGRKLIARKEQGKRDGSIPHGQWVNWLEKNFPPRNGRDRVRRLQHYMQAAEAIDTADDATKTNLNSFLPEGINAVLDEVRRIKQQNKPKIAPLVDDVEGERLRILVGDCRERLKELLDKSVHMVATSPPYFGLRSYDVEPVIWGGKKICKHEWTTYERPGRTGVNNVSPKAQTGQNFDVSEYSVCRRCGAWHGCLGLEPTPGLYVEHICEVFDEVWRVLRDDGTVWLVIGDSFNSGPPGANPGGFQGAAMRANPAYNSAQSREPIKGGYRNGLKPKELMGIPWMLAFALRARGWHLRSEIIWHKRNTTPESVTDRPTKSHETVFLLTKQPTYYYDNEAIKEKGNIPAGTLAAKGSTHRASQFGVNSRPPEYWVCTGTRNCRDVWTIANEPLTGIDHFAPFPKTLVKPMVLAGTSAAGCCSKCGAPWVRTFDRIAIKEYHYQKIGIPSEGEQRGRRDGQCGSSQYAPSGWSPSCSCNVGVVPCRVLDIFAGTGTTGIVANALGRNVVLIEANPKYAAMAQQRIDKELRDYTAKANSEDAWGNPINAARERNRTLIMKLIEWDGTMVPIYVEKDRPRYVETKPSVAG